MVYKERFVAVVKSIDGRILRERNGVVTLPFGSEYSILLKNLDSRRASVKVSVDGQDALYGHSLIINGNTETQLDGILQGTIVNNRFKFIHKTKQIQDHRGDKIDDGMIRVEFAYEKVIVKKSIIHEEYHHHHYDYYPPVIGGALNWNGDGSTGDISRGISTFHSSVCEDSLGVSAQNCSFTSSGGPVGSAGTMGAQSVSMGSNPLAEEGITVPGSKTHQQFTYGSMGELEPSNTLILRLTGINHTGSHVSSPLTVKTKLTCPTCGSKSTSTAKFCASCGTGLEI